MKAGVSRNRRRRAPYLSFKRAASTRSMRTTHPSGSKFATLCSKASARRRLLAQLSPRKSSVPAAAQEMDHSSHGFARKLEPPSLTRSQRRGASENRLRRAPGPASNQLAWFYHACYRSVRAGRRLMRRTAARARTAPPRATFDSRRERSYVQAPSWRAPCGADAVFVRRSVWLQACSAARTAPPP